MSHSQSSTLVVDLFAKTFGAVPDQVWRAPGRVNLIGEHTDYNGGHVLPCALDLSTDLAISRNGSNQIRLVSDRFQDDMICFHLSEASAHAGREHWSRYVSAVVAALQVNGHVVGGCDLAITSTVPDGAGLSSSAALEVVLASALSEAFSLDLDPVSVAQLGQYAENHFVDCQCGIMDQLVSACAIKSHALLIDCDTLNTQTIPLPVSHRIFVIHSGIRRGLVDSEYNQRRAECEEAAKVLGVNTLCSADLTALEQHRGLLSDTVYRRAHHVISEDARCREMASMLKAGRTDQLRHLMSSSHVSMRDDFEVSTEAIDLLVDKLQTVLGDSGGVRMTGGGFGGCVVALAPADSGTDIENRVLPWYEATTGCRPQLWVVNSADGVSKLGRA